MIAQNDHSKDKKKKTAVLSKPVKDDDKSVSKDKDSDEASADKGDRKNRRRKPVRRRQKSNDD